MSDAQKLIREVISKAWAKAQDDAYLHGAWNSSPVVEPDEWAAEIDKALGGLTPTWRARGFWPNIESVSRAASDESHPLERGWVSGWTVTE